MSSPEWLKKAVFYEIYPQSFYDSNDDGVGDLRGIIRKLDYIKAIGFNALWLNPIFESTFFDAGYDVVDYYKVDKRYGGNRALYALIKACKAKGIRLFLDLVPGHTSIASPWFKKSQLARKNEYTDRYIWKEDAWNIDPEFRWVFGFTQRSGAVLTNFFSIQPALNYGFKDIKHPEYEQSYKDEGPQKTIHAIIDVIRHYLRLGVDGFRVDMAGYLVKRDDNKEANIAVWNQIFADVRKDYPEAGFVSEWNEPEKSLRAGFDMDFLLQDPFTQTNTLLTRKENAYFRFNQDTTDTTRYFEDFTKQLCFALDTGHYVSLITDNHDDPRISHYLSPEEMYFWFTFMLTMPNVPFFYYGDELAMPYIGNMTSVEGGYQRTGTRVPMYWDKTKPNAGFSKAKKTLIPVKGCKKSVDVKQALKDKHSLLHKLQDMIAFKQSHIALDNDHTFTLLTNGNSHTPLSYLASKNGETLLIAFNTSRNEQILAKAIAPGDILRSEGDVLLDEDKVILRPHSFLIAKLD